MNQRTARLIRKYAAKSGGSFRQLKRAWNGLSHEDKTRRRAEYTRSLEEPDAKEAKAAKKKAAPKAKGKAKAKAKKR